MNTSRGRISIRARATLHRLPRWRYGPIRHTSDDGGGPSASDVRARYVHGAVAHERRARAFPARCGLSRAERLVRARAGVACGPHRQHATRGGTHRAAHRPRGRRISRLRFVQLLLVPSPDALLAAAKRGTFTDYAAAEQAAMGMVLLMAELDTDGPRAREVEDMFRTLQDDAQFDGDRFARALSLLRPLN